MEAPYHSKLTFISKHRNQSSLKSTRFVARLMQIPNKTVTFVSEPPAAPSTSPSAPRFGSAAATAAVDKSAVAAPLTRERKELEEKLGVTLPPYSTVPCSLFNAPFVGLKNLGATCYMNALLQTMFTTPEIRKHIIAFPFEAQQRHPRNVAYFLQLLFAKMQEKHLWNACGTRELVDSFGMGQDAHREQHDVQELNRVLMDVLEAFIVKSSGAASNTIRDIYEGQWCDVLRCKTCGFTRRTRTPFLDVVLPLCSMMGEAYDAAEGIQIASLGDCLDRFVQKEVIDGVECDGCGGKHAAEKFQTFTKNGLPKVLTLQLLRLQYNVINGTRDKVGKDIALPLVLDMHQWCTDERAGEVLQTTAPPAVEEPPVTVSKSHQADLAAETQQRHASAARTDVEGEQPSTSPVSYLLHAVICHRGTAYHGHYYAFVRCFEGEGQEGKWYLFDDDSVTPVTNDDMLEYLDPAAWKRQENESEKLLQISDGSNLISEKATEASPPPPVRSTDSEPYESFHETDTVVGDFHLSAIGDLLGDSASGASCSSSQRRKKVSGHVYYALYRRSDLPLFSGSDYFEPPLYVRDALQPAQDSVRNDMVKLLDLWFQVPISVWLGDLNRARTAEYRSNALLQHSNGDMMLSPEDGYRMRRLWVNGNWNGPLQDVASSIIEAVGGKSDWLDDDPWLVQLICTAGDGGQIRLRAYDPTLNVFGESYDDLRVLLRDICTPSRNSTLHIGIEFRDPESRMASLSEDENKVAERQQAGSREATVSNARNKWDNAFTVYVQSLINPSDFPVALREIVCCQHGTTVEEFKRMMYLKTSIKEDDIVVTVVSNGESLVRKTGILVGDVVLIERKEPNRPVGNRPDGSSAADIVDNLTVEDVSECAIFPSRAALYMKEQFSMKVVYFYADASVADDDIMVLLNGAAHRSDGTIEEASAPLGSIKIDRRSSLAHVKQRLLIELGLKDRTAAPGKETSSMVCFDPVEEGHQLWIAKTGIAGQPRNMSASLFAMALGAAECRVVLVHRPQVGEHERLVEVFQLHHPIKYEAPTTLLCRLTVSQDTTIQELVKMTFVAAPSITPTPHYRCRLVEAAKTAGLGVPMVQPLVLDNAIRHPPNATLKVLMEFFPANRESPLEDIHRSTLILHAHRWNSMAEQPADALGEEMEVVISKEMPGYALRDYLSEQFDIPVANLQAAPAKLYMLQRHDDAFAKIPWLALSDSQALSKPIVAFPLKLQMDDIIVFRRDDDPWIWVSDEVQHAGHPLLTGGTEPKFGNSVGSKIRMRTKSPASKRFPHRPKLEVTGPSPVDTTASTMTQGCEPPPNGDNGVAAKKRSRNESGITIRAVWEWTNDGAGDATNEGRVETEGDPMTAGEEVALTDCVEGHGNRQQENHNEGGLIDFLEQVDYIRGLHQVLAEDCKICFSSFGNKERICILSCHHIFHVECLEPWLRQKNTCPLCGSIAVQ